MEISTLQKMVDDIMDHFDFNKVAEVMHFLNWKVFYDGKYEVPDVYVLKRMARNDIYTSISDFENINSEDYYMRSGPFAVNIAKDNDGIHYLDLEFVVSHWDVTKYETD